MLKKVGRRGLKGGEITAKGRVAGSSAAQHFRTVTAAHNVYTLYEEVEDKSLSALNTKR